MNILLYYTLNQENGPKDIRHTLKVEPQFFYSNELSEDVVILNQFPHFLNEGGSSAPATYM